MSAAIEPVSRVGQFSIATDMSVEDDTQVNWGEGVLKAFADASAESRTKVQEMTNSLNGDYSVAALSKFSINMTEWRIKEMLVSHMASEATKGFKTLTQQS